MSEGVGDIYREVMSWEDTPDSYRAMIAWGKDELFSLHMMEQDYLDHTPIPRCIRPISRCSIHYSSILKRW